MKLKILFLMLALALTSFAQTAAPAAPDVKTCACCNHDQAGTADKSAMKCPMMSGDKAGMKCPMMAKDGRAADGKMCCSSNKCKMHDNSAKNSCCCGHMDGQKQPGM